MMMYNWNSLIINPYEERLKDLIGEEVYASTSPMYTLITAEEGSFVQKLVKINPNYPQAPFVCLCSNKGIDDLKNYPCIIPKNRLYYSYEEIIFSPYDYRLSKIKGKKVFASSTPNDLLNRLNSGREVKSVDLVEVNARDSFPFHTSDGEWWTCIMEAKEG